MKKEQKDKCYCKQESLPNKWLSDWCDKEIEVVWGYQAETN